MDNVARIVLALEEHDVAEEVMHFLDRSGRARVVATAGDARQLAEAVRQVEPDAVIASPALLRSGAGAGSAAVLAVDTAESVSSLRGAISGGARGYYIWPDEREELAAASLGIAASRTSTAPRGLIVAVCGSRGGAGVTFLATHLAAAFARRRRDCVLVDVDLAFDDVGAALALPIEEAAFPTLRDLAADGSSDAARIANAPWTHPAGFRVIPGSVDPVVGSLEASAVVGALESVARAADVALIHVPRSVSEVARAALELADVVCVVLTQDVASFRSAKRLVAVLGIEERCRFVLNRAGRADIVAADVARVFGRPTLGVVPVSRSAARAQDLGVLLPPRGRTARAIDRIAARLLERS